MPLDTVRQEVAIRFSEVQSFLSEIKQSERPSTAPSQETNIKKGLFLVLLYSALEYQINRSIIEYTQTVNLAAVKYIHISDDLHALTLDPELMSCAMAGRKQRWQKRVELFKKQNSGDRVQISESAFLEQLENIWTTTIRKIFSVLGISDGALYSPRVGQYIDEVVEKRNAVAHGRESAATIGRSYTIGTLQTLHDELSMQAQYIMACFERHLDEKHFIKLQFRGIY